ncbi:F-box/LRR-repeat protein At3g26922 [Linum perenne]
MEKSSAKSTVVGEEEDPISELPNEILHSVLSLLTPKERARTNVLSRRWRHIWDSYPVVEFYETSLDQFQKLSESTLNRFSRNKLLRMESLKIMVQSNKGSHRSQVSEQLLNLASERKAMCVEVTTCCGHFPCDFPFQLLSNSTVTILSLNNVRLFFDINGDKNLILSLNSLRSLHLHNVQFLDDRIFANLIASCPLLDNLKLGSVKRMSLATNMNLSLSSLRFLHLYHVKYREFQDFIARCPLLETLELQSINYIDGLEVLTTLQNSNIPNLKTLKIFYCRNLDEIEIAAPELRSFHLRKALGFGKEKLSRLELIAPRLNVLEMINSGLNAVDLEVMVSKLQSLETLIVEGLSPT